MKRTIIRSTVMALAVLAISISVKAQSAQQYNADIPFDFEVRGQNYPAGKYRLASVSVSSPGAIALHEVKSGKGGILGISSNMGTNNWDNPGTLTFLKANGKYRLTQISTASFELRMKEPKTDVRDIDALASARTVIRLH